MSTISLKSSQLIFRIILILVLIGVFVGFAILRMGEDPKQRALRIQNEVAVVAQSNDFKKCEEFKGQMVNGLDYGIVCKNNAVMNAAITNLDVAICENIDPSLNTAEECRSQVEFKKMEVAASTTETQR